MNTEVVRKLIEDRLEELDNERDELKQALTELGGRKSRRKRSRGSANGSGNGSKPRSARRRRKGGTRAEHAEKAVADNPGIKASEIAEQLKIKPNYVYRVMGDLLKDGRVAKKGMGYFPVESKS